MRGHYLPTVVLADDHGVFRESLQATIEARQWGAVAGSVADGRAAVEFAGRLRPDVTVLDVCLPLLSGIEATARIAQAKTSHVLILSGYSDSRHVERALRAGALGYITKRSTLDELHQAIAAVAEGRSYLSPDLAKLATQLVTDDRPKAHRSDALSSRECEVLQLLAGGLSSKEIAKQLSISVATVHSHRHSIMEKSGIHKVAGLVRLAIREGMVRGLAAVERVTSVRPSAKRQAAGSALAEGD